MDYGDAHHEHLKINTIVSNNNRGGFTKLTPVVDNSDNGSSSRQDTETNPKQTGLKNSDSSDTVSSSSSDSSSDNFFNPSILPKFRVKNDIPKPNNNAGTKSSYKHDKFDVSSEALYRLEESIHGSPESTSQFSDVTYESLVPHMSPTLSPIVQVMERPGDYDPNRIPSSIFSRPSTPTEWSVASNDSLFSIHIGNNSFSRDHTSRTGVDLYKSGELPKSGELLKSGELCQSGDAYKPWELFQSGELHQSREHLQSGAMKKSSELVNASQASPTRKGAVKPNKILDVGKTMGEDVHPGEIRRMDETMYDVPKAIVSSQVDENTEDSRDSCSTNYHTDKSETSIPSFTLTIKKKSSWCPMCSCSSCYEALCSCKCSFCSCKWIRWPSCSFKCFVWPKCFRNCLSCRGGCCCCRRCKFPKFSCCCRNCPSCTNCRCPSWNSCKCHSCSNCASSACWDRTEPKKSSYDSPYILTDEGIKNIPPKSSSSSRRHCCSCSLC